MLVQRGDKSTQTLEMLQIPVIADPDVPTGRFRRKLELAQTWDLFADDLGQDRDPDPMPAHARLHVAIVRAHDRLSIGEAFHQPGDIGNWPVDVSWVMRRKPFPS